MEKAKGTLRRAPVLEVIACSVSDAIEAQRGGAHRLEIIRDFSRGGLTPSLALVQDILDAVTLPLRVMLREDEGYEVSGEDERGKLGAAARELSRLKVEGVVLGFLREGKINVQLTEWVLSCAPNLRATFHHAFDETDDPIAAIGVLRQLKQVDHILTSGGTGSWSERIERLSRYEQKAGNEMAILAGGGMDQESIRMICRATGIREFHVGRSARQPFSVTGVVRSERVKTLVETAQESC